MANKIAERSAKEIIGEAAWKVMINAASGGRINAQQMRDIVWDLPSNQKANKLGAKHDSRMNERGTCADETEMKNILADWNYHGIMPAERVEALEVLIKVFEKNGNKPLARDLKKIKDKEEQVPYQ